MNALLSRLSPYLLWTILALPGLGMVAQSLTADSVEAIEALLHPSGEFAARFMIIAMLATPLMVIFRTAAFPRWLKRNRRYFGVAAFGYAALHTLFYVIDAASIDRVVTELPRLYIWTGWVAFAIFVPLAVTSADWAVRAMGPAWKSLQRWTYAAAVLTLLHWAALHDWGGVAPALVHFGPLAALEGWRAWDWMRRRRARLPLAV